MLATPMPTANDAINHQLVKGVAQGAAHCREGKHHRRDNHRSLATQTVAQSASGRYTQYAAHQGTPHIPTLLPRIEAVELGHLADGAANHRSVVAKEESTSRSHQGQKNHITYMIVFHNLSSSQKVKK